MADHPALERWELGVDDAADHAALAALLADPAARRAFVRRAQVAAALAARPAARRRRWPWLAAAAGLLLAAGAAALLAPAAALAQVAAGGGRDAAGRALAAGMDLPAGSAVVAGPDGLALELAGGAARLELAAGARLALPAAVDPGLRLELAAGRLLVAAAPRPPGSPLLVATPAATAAVVGTRFRLEADGVSTRLAVEEGSVRLAAAQEVLVPAGVAALAADGLVGLAPPAPPPLPPTAGRMLWQAAAGAAGWGAAVDPGPAWRSHPPRPGDPWSRCELRSPVAAALWRVEPGARLRFTYWHTGFPPGQELTVHLKPADESNYAAVLALDPAPGWHLAELPVEGRFRHRGGRGPLRAGESIHGLVWLIAGDGPGPPAAGRFWIGAVAVVGR